LAGRISEAARHGHGAARTGESSEAGAPVGEELERVNQMVEDFLSRVMRYTSDVRRGNFFVYFPVCA